MHFSHALKYSLKEFVFCLKFAKFALLIYTKPIMNRFLATLFFTLLISLSAAGENIIVGERLPDMSIRKWLMDIQPTNTEYTCILFYNSTSELCQESLENIKQYISNHEKELNLIIVTKEEYSKAGVTLTRHLNDYTGVAFDDNGRTFKSFGVKYIPFCVISRKNRVVWCGNSLALNDTTLNKILIQ